MKSNCSALKLQCPEGSRRGESWEESYIFGCFQFGDFSSRQNVVKVLDGVEELRCEVRNISSQGRHQYGRFDAGFISQYSVIVNDLSNRVRP